jgi:tRNA A37 threonylcarbamoyladenosine dehydratase
MNQFARTKQLLGPENMEKIRKAKVAVFGLGAVGSFVVEALARTGVGRLVLVDFDRVEVSNINRQLPALHSTIGREKTGLVRERIADINPQCRVECRNSFVNADSLGKLLTKDMGVVVDAIDGLNSKINLIVSAREMNLEVVSSMGAGGRTDAAMIRTADISETCVCPLARVVRQRLHRRGLYHGVRAVYSIEKPLNKQPYKPEDAGDGRWDHNRSDAGSSGDTSFDHINSDHGSISGHGRPRPPIGTVPWIPGIFGLTIAGEVIHLITDQT